VLHTKKPCTDSGEGLMVLTASCPAFHSMKTKCRVPYRGEKCIFLLTNQDRRRPNGTHRELPGLPLHEDEVQGAIQRGKMYILAYKSGQGEGLMVLTASCPAFHSMKTKCRVPRTNEPTSATHSGASLK
jgi:hypothetical protein